MAVNDADPAWGKHATDRKKVADLIAGRAEAVSYISRRPGWDDATLKNIQESAYFLPMVARTVETFGGLVFLKAPTRKLPAGLDGYVEDITQSGQEIDRFAEQGFDAVLQTGGMAILVDYPASDQNLTVAQAEAQGVRPVLRLYDANAILAARFTKVGAARRLTQVRLLETVEEPDSSDADGFKMVSIQQVRVLEIVNGVYRQTIWRADSGAWRAVETIEPRMQRKPLTSIPIFFSNTRDGEAVPAKPPLTDLADINIAHLNNSAGMEWSLIWLSSPILFGSGIKLADGETLKVGSSEAILTETAGAKLEIVTLPSEGVGAIKQAMDDKRRDAATLGARMLMESPKAAITAETARIERAGETSVVGAIANAVSQALTNALAFLAQWAGVSGEVEYWLNTDLMPTRMTPQELTALLEAWSRGALSKQELFSRFQEAEVVDPAKSFEDHEEEIAEAGEGLGIIEAEADET